MLSYGIAPKVAIHDVTKCFQDLRSSAPKLAIRNVAKPFQALTKAIGISLDLSGLCVYPSKHVPIYCRRARHLFHSAWSASLSRRAPDHRSELFHLQHVQPVHDHHSLDQIPFEIDMPMHQVSIRHFHTPSTHPWIVFIRQKSVRKKRTTLTPHQTYYSVQSYSMCPNAPAPAFSLPPLPPPRKSSAPYSLDLQPTHPASPSLPHLV